MLVHFLGRSAIIGTGLWLGGFQPKEAVRGALAGAVLFEASLLLWSAKEVSKHGTDA
jgi:hypothetical protein